MKKHLFALLVCCLAGTMSSCEKDRDDDNPFAGTVWKCRCQVTFSLPGGGYGNVPGYKVFRFNSDRTYMTWDEDENRVVVNRSGGGHYRLYPRERLLRYYRDPEQVLGVIGYREGLPTGFVHTESDGKEYLYWRQ